MNTIKPICLSAIALVVLAGCGTQKQVASYTAIEGARKIVPKTPQLSCHCRRWIG
jgi:hypothetical protein